ncbi:NAD(P)-dependent oxidoreductase [Spirillospora sp. CA-255316]
MTTTDTRAPVTILGTGPMGQALARAFLKAGHPTTVWNRTAVKTEALVSEGASATPTAADAAAASPLVIVCVLDYDAVQAISESAASALKGRTLLSLTADSPERARAMAEWASGHGIDYLDGSIMTPTVTIGGPAAVFLYSGPEPVYRAHRDTLDALGGTGTYLGADPGRAAAFDVALLDIAWTSVSAIIHAYALARSEGITPGELAPFAAGILGMLPEFGTEIVRVLETGDFRDDTSNATSIAAGMEHVIQASEARGIDASSLRGAHAAARRAIDAGHGTESLARVIDFLNTPTP